MTDCWVNVMSKGCAHTLHLHPTSVISGTYYVRVPRGGAPIRFEDPRHAHRMATPPRRVDARPRNQSMVAHEASSGTVVLFESWLRHEVPASRVATRRVLDQLQLLVVGVGLRGLRRGGDRTVSA